MDVLDWLLEEEAPAVALQARTHLLDESPRTRACAALRRRLDDYPPVARMLERVDEAIAVGDYQKYRGAYWTLLFLAEMHADPRDPRARRLARHVLGTQLPSGGFAPRGDSGWEIVCLTANVLRSLVHFGLGRDPGVVRGYRRLAERIGACGGVPCRIIDELSLLTTCKMTLPQTLRAATVAPAGVPRRAVAELRRVLVRRMLEVRLHRYVRPDARRFYQEVVPGRPAGTKVAELKARYLEAHPERELELVPKPGWLRFGFPLSYNPDLLEALLALAEAGVPHEPALDEALDHVEARRGKDGRWRLDRSLNGKMLARVERKGAPSRWLTLRALRVLRHFGRAGS